MKRRTFIQGTLAAGVAGIAAPAAMAKWSADTFEAKGMDAAIAALKAGEAEASDKIKIKAPEIAENGMVVPVQIKSDIEGTETISLLVAENGTPLTATYTLGEGAAADVKSRIKMGKTSDVIALVTAGGKTYKNHVSVKVTKGGCGG